MNCCCIEIVSQTASFRNPEFQNFHKTLDLPSPTTIIGLSGAALGLSPQMAQIYFDDTRFKIGIAGNFMGKAKDTWKYNKRSNQMHLYDPLLDGSVIQRELLIHNHFFLAFCSENKMKLDELAASFANPVFALTMGSSDSLAMIKSISVDQKIQKSKILENCIVSGDIVEAVIINAFNGLDFSVYQTTEPITFDLPTRFNYQSDYGKRSVKDIATFSFVGRRIEINFEMEGILFQDNFIPIFDL